MANNQKINKIIDNIATYLIFIVLVLGAIYYAKFPYYFAYTQDLNSPQNGIKPHIGCSVEDYYNAIPHSIIFSYGSKTCRAYNLPNSKEELYVKYDMPPLYFILNNQLLVLLGVFIFFFREYFTKTGIKKVKSDFIAMKNRFSKSIPKNIMNDEE